MEMQSAGTLTIHGCQSILVLIRTLAWVHNNAFASDFTSVVLIRTPPGALISFSSALLTCFAMNSSWYTYSYSKLDSLENN